MFDLNIEMEANKTLSSVNNDKVMEFKDELLEGSGTNTELSGTSSTSSEFNFFDSGEFVTRQFFPLSNERETEQLDLIRVGSSQPTNSALYNHHQWLNLSVSGSGLGSGHKQQVRKSRRGPRSRSSQYRGVTFYRRTGRWESHIWDCGKQVYLGGFDTALAAARAYDRAAIKFRGVEADINFNIADYDEEMEQMKNLSKEEFVHILRRQSTGFSRGSSRYRGVTLHKCGRWEARMGQLLGKKYIYLGLFDNEVEAARAYDMAAIRCNGREAVTNFEASSYEGQQPMQANNAGNGHNLDLNLGISVTTDGPKESDRVGARELQTDHFPFRPANEKMPMNESSTYSLQSAQAMYVQQPALRQPTITWPDTYKDKVRDQKVEAHFSSGSLSNWSWLMQSRSQGGGGGSGGATTTQIQPLSIAASSGFSFSATPPSSSTFPLIIHPQPRLL